MTSDAFPRITSGRLGWADFARGAAIVCVVYFHATLFLGTVGIDQTLGRVKLALELFPLPAFFLIAGIFSARSILDGSFRDLVLKRLLPLGYVYVLWSVLRFALFAAFPALPSRETDIAPTDPMSLVLLPALPASLYWFLYALLLFTIVMRLVRRLRRWIVLTAAAVLSTLFTTGVVNTSTIAWDRIGALLFFFAAGVLMSREIIAAMSRARAHHLVFAVAGYAAIVAVLFFFRGASRVPFVVLAGQCLAVAAALLISRQLVKVPMLGFVSSIGRTSLPIYLVHILVIPPIAYALGLVDPDWPAVVNITVTVAVTTVALLAGYGLQALAFRAPWLLAPILRVRSRGRPDAQSERHPTRSTARYRQN
ncbi:acyltransferase [Microbacterium sp. NPDC019599]|uniref:acyltransferase n=1 Tax=Microbacterium sp. NPDC019599 TaxID=3154690 RepID=UPI0033D213FB